MREKESFLDKEHTELLEKIQELSMREGDVGESFKAVMKIFSFHLDREEETVIPLLEYLRRRALKEPEPMHERISTASRGFQQEYGSMLSEHREIETLLEAAERSSSAKVNEVLDLIRALRHHVEIEEEILYPAALAAGTLFNLENPHA